MVVRAGDRTDEFEALRPRLQAVAYRLTGSVADAEDIVQDAWLRLYSTTAEIEDLAAWLTTVVSRLGLDRLRSAVYRRETYVGEWLPEPVVTGLDGDDPLAALVASEDARFAAMVVLDRLAPDQRVAFVLHDGFSVPFKQIADILGISDAAARQLASRARRMVTATPEPVADAEHNEVVGKLLEALVSGSVEAVVRLLHPDVTMTGDSDGKAPTAVRVIHGPDKVARFLLGLMERYGPQMTQAINPALVNGQFGMYLTETDTDPNFRPVLPRVSAFTVRDGRVLAVWDVSNPDKFSGTPLREA
ncbi:Probable alternative RNA polymerase sigma factor SigJ [Mycobacteroides abscessus subsp. abscessus]|uniref:sigma-70 family RNA polymerase sigma factor n=1 Tax=Mycobacteroides abscessus TaxID=36809 RepID=UPI0009A8400B|nr:sigma-70 family RNA polymerase sigma factor [Mycobacteroides abscessus]SLE63655.1 Probable alternative RNA polymerase sigma factor SigJ [Mycobacteroides abscessus subsp. abscessus]SLE89965.1 Probable alternative RNA polymerase sigma factor SigJ [Mycobacteroides abscessus subsp. abscessus]SLF54557.1 Probable alternative RNA polymerase sigma factor SigJ [Mycobacteroides abscessus subsp. abscessus]SLG51939.1 Probable alternative RNA polymerase sigma factor SigJ [Mycobacteroides abscessus subsp.